MTDWTGNYKTNWSCLGASNHSKGERQEVDFYSTDPVAVDELCKVEEFNSNVWECACGNGVMAEALKKNGYEVYSSDLYDHNYGVCGVDFLEQDCNLGGGDIITNPPFKHIAEFIEKGLELTDRKLAIFARIQLLESKKRWERIWRDSPLRKVYVFVNRVKCYKNDVRSYKGSAVCYGWFVWDKEYTGEATVDWIYKVK